MRNATGRLRSDPILYHTAPKSQNTRVDDFLMQCMYRMHLDFSW